jgi:aprataxin
MALKSGFFTEALRQYALVKSPSTQIPPSTLLIESPECIAIFDAYPKAKYHFLVLPRPFIPSGSTRPISTDDLDDLRSLLDMNKDARKEVVQAIRAMAEEVVEMVKDEMMKTEGFTWGVDMGFHAVPSMK